MATLVQSFPSSTMTMLQPRPASTDAFHNGQQRQQGYSSGTPIPRNMYGTSAVEPPASNLRAGNMQAQMAPYTYAHASVMPQGSNPLRQHPTTQPRLDARTSSAPQVPMARPRSAQMTFTAPSLGPSPAFVPLQQTSSLDGGPGMVHHHHSGHLAGNDWQAAPMVSYAHVAKASPDRYRRHSRQLDSSANLPLANRSNINAVGQNMPSGSGMASVGHLYTHINQSNSTSALGSFSNQRPFVPNHAHASSNPTEGRRPAAKEDVVSNRNSTDLAKRYRRRSVSSLDAKDYVSASENDLPPQEAQQKPKSYAAMLAGPAPSAAQPVRPSTMYDRQPSSTPGRIDSASVVDCASSPTAPKSTGAKSFAFKSSADTHVPSAPVSASSQQTAKHDTKPAAHSPARPSTDQIKRISTPSPLSRPVAANSRDIAPSQPQSKSSLSVAALPPASPDMIDEEIGDNQPSTVQGKKEGKSSRLRRAFSFGSAAELRKASAENNAAAARERTKLQKNQFADEEEAQQAAIAMRQEASGLGEGIYSGQGNFFTGSTDNLSISSTASSASIMIRKMGKGMKRGSRSLVGLFRPKSVVGVPAADAALPESSVAQVSMVTVEAERAKVNVNLNPHDQAGGGTGFPHLERNSLETAGLSSDLTAASSLQREITPRRSIVVGDRERAEILGAVKKGILKHSGSNSASSSPQVRPTENQNYVLPPIPRINGSPTSSIASTPGAEESSLRTESLKAPSARAEEADYFAALQNYNRAHSPSSLPGTPRSMNRNISFSPRIIFHDTWPSGEYDRRGEIATCNRLTPILAQQIKEELNTFKMEMEVHSESKVHTHFF